MILGDGGVIKTILAESTEWKRPQPKDEVMVTYSIKVRRLVDNTGVRTATYHHSVHMTWSDLIPVDYTCTCIHYIVHAHMQNAQTGRAMQNMQTGSAAVAVNR